MVQANNITIGGTATGAGNLISGNFIGIEMYQTSGPSDNVAEGNLIGTDASGTVAIPNTYGIALYGSTATSNTIGGTTDAARNVVSGNTDDGIAVSSVGELVIGNFIGVNITGTVALPNNNGVNITASGSANTIGVTATAGTGAGNVISGNLRSGVILSTNNNVVLGNLIGTDYTGEVAIPNENYGINSTGRGETIGGTVAGSANVVSANSDVNIVITGSGATVVGNIVGLDLAGTVSLSSSIGNDIQIQSSGNTIGGLLAQRCATSSPAHPRLESSSSNRGPPAMSSRATISARMLPERLQLPTSITASRNL